MVKSFSLTKVSAYATLTGRLWTTVLFLLRIVVITSIGYVWHNFKYLEIIYLMLFREHVYGDEQSAFDCNTKETGCPNACYSGSYFSDSESKSNFSLCTDFANSILGSANYLRCNAWSLFCRLFNTEQAQVISSLSWVSKVWRIKPTVTPIQCCLSNSSSQDKVLHFYAPRFTRFVTVPLINESTIA